MADFDPLIAAAPDPELAALRFERMREDAALRAELDTLAENENIAADFIAIAGYSTFLFNYLCRNPQALRLLGEPCEFDPEDLDGAQDHEALRHYKYQQLLKITWMDVSGAYPYEVVLNRLSRLADVIVAKALRLSFAADRQGDLADFISVFGLGKLGASELNYSSDVDLILVGSNYDEAGMDAHELQARLVKNIRRFTRSLEEITYTGFLYRVDLKLRPWGKSGPLFLSADETENYYEASTEAWERMAWLRARCVAGAETMGKEFLERMRPFTFRRSLSLSDLERFVSIKEEMAKVRETSGQWHVKLGTGGIRDIEFFIQILQLLNAGKHPVLQKTNTLTVLGELRELDFVSPEEEQEIKKAYLFLRRLENRLQMADEKQVHALPDDEDGRIRVARSLSVPGASDAEILANFDSLLSANRAIAGRYFEKVLAGAGREAEAAKKPPVTFDTAWNKTQAETSFARWVELCEKEKWGDRPENKNLLINIFGASWYFTRYIFFRGYEITELIDHYSERVINAQSISDSLYVDADEDDLEHGLYVLSSVKNQWMLCILIQFLQGETTLPELEENLTTLAECVFVAVIRELVKINESVFRNMAVLGMGRMAGSEMIFGSDLDLIFLYKSRTGDDTTQISKQVQGLLRHLSTVSPAGLLYEVDTRLRPHGNSGSLVTSVDSFTEYHCSDRAVWERQMMTRCRPIYDPDKIGAEALQVISGAIYASHEVEELRDEIAKMRHLIEETLGQPHRKHEIKRGQGGLMDIDFLTHFLQLSHGRERPELQTASTRTALRRLAEANCLSAETAQTLLADYDFLKRMEVCIRLIDLKAASVIPKDVGQNAVLSRGMGYEDGAEEAFMADFMAATGRIRAEFNRHLPPVED